MTIMLETIQWQHAQACSAQVVIMCQTQGIAFVGVLGRAQASYEKGREGTWLANDCRLPEAVNGLTAAKRERLFLRSPHT